MNFMHSIFKCILCISTQNKITILYIITSIFWQKTNPTNWRKGTAITVFFANIRYQDCVTLYHQILNILYATYQYCFSWIAFTSFDNYIPYKYIFATGLLWLINRYFKTEWAVKYYPPNILVVTPWIFCDNKCLAT